MNHRTFATFFLTGLIAVCCPCIQSQQTSFSNEGQSTEARVREKAFDLLESLAGQIGNLQSAENRARIGSNLADSLWNHDESRARALLASVENDIRAGLQPRDTPVTDDPREQQTMLVFLRLRSDTVERLVKHDAALALTFLKSTALASNKRLPYGSENDRSIELRLAKQIAADRPEVALKIGRQSLERNFSGDLVQLLTTLQRKHSEQALVLYKEIVLKLRQTNLSRNWEAAYLARSLASSFVPPLVDETTYRELVELLVTSALGAGCGGKNSTNYRFCSLIGSLLPQIEKADARAVQLRPWSRQDRVSDYSQVYSELEVAAQNSAVERILELAKKYPSMRREIYWRAFSKTLTGGDIEQARKIANDFEVDPDTRRSMLAQIDAEQKWASLSAEKLAEAQATLNTLPNIWDRVSTLLYLANRIGPTDRKGALMLLDQASGLVEAMKSEREQTQTRLFLSMFYCLFKSDRGFTMMETLLPTLNELVAAAVRLDGFETNYVRDGEWNMSGEGNLGRLLTGLAQQAAVFAWCDFDRAVSLAAQFERPEIRLMAQLKLAQGILAGPIKSLPIVAPPRW